MSNPDRPIDSSDPDQSSRASASETSDASADEPIVAEFATNDTQTFTNSLQQPQRPGGQSPYLAGSPSGPLLRESHLHSRRRRVRLPVTLFIVTCLSTFWAGVTGWQPLSLGGLEFRQLILRDWDQGLIYMACVVGILLTHEMGHFIATLIYRIPASLPFFIPLPVITPIGTMGAVIGMEGQRANRKQIFDIGIAGPLAGLVVAAPILWIGVAQLELSKPAYGAFLYDCPLIVRWMISWIQPEYASVKTIGTSQLNPYFMAGWVGLLITGLNMMPVSQLDGGHVIYGLFLKRAHFIARGFILSAMAYIVFGDAMIWSLMVILVVLMGTDHPPTANDRMPLGRFRFILGVASLSIPVLCFPIKGLIPVGF